MWLTKFSHKIMREKLTHTCEFVEREFWLIFQGKQDLQSKETKINFRHTTAYSLRNRFENERLEEIPIWA